MPLWRRCVFVPWEITLVCGWNPQRGTCFCRGHGSWAAGSRASPETVFAFSYFLPVNSTWDPCSRGQDGSGGAPTPLGRVPPLLPWGSWQSSPCFLAQGSDERGYSFHSPTQASYPWFPSCYLAPLRYLFKTSRVWVVVPKGNQEGRDELWNHTLKQKSLSSHCG